MGIPIQVKPTQYDHIISDTCTMNSSCRMLCAGFEDGGTDACGGAGPPEDRACELVPR